MTDRELLELAAKAAGLKHLEWVSTRSGGLMVHVCRDDSGRREERWNPLDDDGDALRLAVKLEIVLSFERPQEVSASRPGDGWEYPEEWAEHNGDRNAATRRAIVRAAAEIGRQERDKQ